MGEGVAVKMQDRKEWRSKEGRQACLGAWQIKYSKKLTGIAEERVVPFPETRQVGGSYIVPPST